METEPPNARDENVKIDTDQRRKQNDSLEDARRRRPAGRPTQPNEEQRCDDERTNEVAEPPGTPGRHNLMWCDNPCGEEAGDADRSADGRAEARRQNDETRYVLEPVELNTKTRYAMQESEARQRLEGVAGRNSHRGE
jgi:hypothetical protein